MEYSRLESAEPKMPFPYRILVVDDEPALLATAESLLKSKGYEVRTAADGFEALVELRRSLPDVLISDLSMPNVNDSNCSQWCGDGSLRSQP